MGAGQKVAKSSYDTEYEDYNSVDNSYYSDDKQDYDQKYYKTEKET